MAKIKDSMKLLAVVNNFNIYVDYLGFTWLDEALLIENGDNLIRITVDSGEMENDFGEFMFAWYQLNDEELEIAYDVLSELADPLSHKHFADGHWRRFSLKEEYYNKLEHLNNEAPTRI